MIKKCHQVSPRGVTARSPTLSCQQSVGGRPIGAERRRPSARLRIFCNLRIPHLSLRSFMVKLTVWLSEDIDHIYPPWWRTMEQWQSGHELTIGPWKRLLPGTCLSHVQLGKDEFLHPSFEHKVLSVPKASPWRLPCFYFAVLAARPWKTCRRGGNAFGETKCHIAHSICQSIFVPLSSLISGRFWRCEVVNITHHSTAHGTTVLKKHPVYWQIYTTLGPLAVPSSRYTSKDM